MDRKSSEYQIVTPRGTMKIDAATLDEVKAELMRAYDVIQHLEDKLHPLLTFIDDFIVGRSKDVDAVLTKEEAAAD